MRAISAPRSHRTVKIRSPLPRGPSIASGRSGRSFATNVLPLPMCSQAYANCSGTRRQSRSHTARFTS